MQAWFSSIEIIILTATVLDNLIIITDVPGAHKGLSRRSDHYKERTKCLNYFATFYGGHLPLHYSSERIHRA